MAAPTITATSITPLKSCFNARPPDPGAGVPGDGAPISVGLSPEPVPIGEDLGPCRISGTDPVFGSTTDLLSLTTLLATGLKRVLPPYRN